MAARDVSRGLTPGVSVRAEFPIFEHAIYANSCSQGALSNRVRAAAEEWLAGWDENGAEWEYWVERNEAARAAFAGLVHAEPDDVAVTTSVSQGVSALVSALDLSGERNRIVISEYEFPTVGQIAHAQELRGAEVVHVTPGGGRPHPARALRRGDRRADGARLLHRGLLPLGPSPRRLRDRRARPREHGALVLADSYQAIGALELDVRTLGADVVTGGTVKYLLGSAGLAFMWLRGSLRAQLLRRRRAGSPTRTSSRCPSPTTRRTRPRAASTAARRPCRRSTRASRGWSSIAEVGVPAIEAHVRGLVDRLLAGLDELGATVATPRGEREYGPLICVVSTDPNALVAALAAEQIVTSTRDSNLRDLAPPLQRRGGRRPHSRRVAREPRTCSPERRSLGSFERFLRIGARISYAHGRERTRPARSSDIERLERSVKRGEDGLEVYAPRLREAPRRARRACGRSSSRPEPQAAPRHGARAGAALRRCRAAGFRRAQARVDDSAAADDSAPAPTSAAREPRSDARPLRQAARAQVGARPRTGISSARGASRSWAAPSWRWASDSSSFSLPTAAGSARSMRIALGATASALVFTAGLVLRARYGQYWSALAAVAAGIAGAYATLAAAAAPLRSRSGRLALPLAGVIAAAGTVVAIRWRSQVIAGIGLLGAALAPGCRRSTRT